MEVETNVIKASWLLLTLTAFVPGVHVLNAPMSANNFQITRHNSGDIFSQYSDADAACTEETCVGMSSGTASALSARDLCTCRCHPHLPAFREDLRICVDDIHECVLAPFVGGSTSQQIPFVFLPLKGQIIHPSKDISFAGIRTPVCVVSGAKFMTESGWMDLRNPIDTDVPFRLFRDEGRTFLQWIGEPDLRNKMSGRLVMVYLMCREVATNEPVNGTPAQSIFSPCVAFRVVGTPTKYLSNVSEVAFVADAHADKSSSESEHLSISEYVAIGICSILLGLIYVASVFLYLHLRKRNNSSPNDKSGMDNQSIEAVEEGIVKSNPLLSMTSHFAPSDSVYSDTSNSDTEATPDIIQHQDDRKKHMQITSVMIHSQRQYYNVNSHRSPYSSLEHTYQDSTTNERLPEENVSIVETLEGREEQPDNLKALVGTTRKKLYFNPAYFEPQLLLTPPPAALEFLAKIREVISIAKQKMESKRFTPSLLNIPEEESQYPVEPTYEFSKPAGSRRSSIISLKRENSRRKTCTGCPGCESQDFKSLNGKLPEFPSLAACQNCTATNNDIKQRSIRKWLEGVPILNDKDESSSSQDMLNSLSSVRIPKRLRSPTRSLPPEDIDTQDLERAVSPRPASERGLRQYDFYRHQYASPQKRKKIIYKQNIPPPVTRNDENISLKGEENYYDTVPEEEKREVTVNLPPPDMICEAMAVDKSEDKVATLTKKQMNAVINEFNLIIPQVESVVPDKETAVVDYETDSLERSGINKGFSTPTEYAEVTSSQPSPSLSTALPDQEEMTMRNAIFNKKTGNMTISKINMDVLQEDDHDYELIVMKKGSVIDTNLYKLPELLQRNDGYSLVSEVYVNNGYNYGSTPSSPEGSDYSTLEKKYLKVKYEEGNDKPGKLLIEVEDCPDHYIPVNDSDGFEPDTLDRKTNKYTSKLNALRDNEFIDSLERPNQILLRTTGSFKRDAVAAGVRNVEQGNFNRVFGSLREIYEAKTKGNRNQQELRAAAPNFNSEGRILTLEERHSKRQRAKVNMAQPDVIPPPPHDEAPIYEHPKPPRKVIAGENFDMKPPLPPKNLIGRSVSSHQNPNALTSNHPYTNSGTPAYNTDDYELCLVQRSKKDGNIKSFIQTEDIVLKRNHNNQFILHATNHMMSCPFSLKPTKPDASPFRCKNQRYIWQNTLKPDDSGYLSSDSNESRLVRSREIMLDLPAAASETDESLGDGHSESGAESVETHSVFFGSYHRKPVNYYGFGAVSRGVIGGEEGHSSIDSEAVSYTTVVSVPGTLGTT